MTSKREWQQFIGDHSELLRRLEVHEECYSTIERFKYFLMHGTYPGCPFSLPPHSQMDESTRALVSGLVADYLAAGFEDPGVDILSWEDVQALKR
jgi:hypothetical protein